MRGIAIQVGPELFTFSNVTNWCNKAQSRYRECGLPLHKTVAIDAKGRICVSGLEFMRAGQDETYPITVFAINEVIDG